MDRIRESWRTLAICGLLGGMVLGAYWPVLHNGFVQYDDADYVTENVHTLSGLSWENVGWAFRSGFAANWHPLTWMSHMLDGQLYGLKPTGHHLTSLALHAANALLLFLFFRRTTGALWRSAFVAALFALHPLHVESVAWVAERKDVLSAFFFLLTLLAYAAYAGRVEPGGGRRERGGAQGCGPRARESGQGQITNRTGWYALSLLFLACGLMSKAMLVTAPFVLLLVDVWPLDRWQLEPATPVSGLLKRGLPLLREKVPFLALAAGASLITFLVQDQGHATALGLPWGPRVANAIVSYLKYLGKTAWPVDLMAFYPHPDLRYPLSTQWPLWAIVLSALLLAAVSFLAWRAVRRAPWFFTGWFWYLGMLVPVIGLVQVGGQALADRYTYLPLIGIFLCLAWGTSAWWSQNASRRGLLATAGLAAVATCGVLTHTQAGYWRNNSTLWQHALAVSPNNPLANYNVGSELARAGRFEPALPYLQRAVEENPNDAEAQSALALVLAGLGRQAEAAAACQQALRLRPWNAMAHNTLGTLLWLQGKRQAAKQEYGEALRCKPGFAEAYYSLGLAALNENQLPEATHELTEAVEHKPQSPEFRLGLGQALSLAGRFPEAQVQLAEAVRLCPTNLMAQLALGNTLMETGRTNEAAGCFAAALRLDPALPRKSLEEAKTLLGQGQPLQALSRFLIAARLQPDNAEAQENLGLLYAQLGKLEEAVPHFQERLRLQPDAQGWYNLGLARVMQGQPAAAAAAYEQALQLKPDWPQALNDLAWLRATTPAAELRNGAEAVRLAQRACELSGGKEPSYWGTLDAAYAELGRFAEAITTAEKARALALAGGQSNLVQAAEERLALYRKQQPYRQ